MRTTPCAGCGKPAFPDSKCSRCGHLNESPSVIRDFMDWLSELWAARKPPGIKLSYWRGFLKVLKWGAAAWLGFVVIVAMIYRRPPAETAPAKTSAPPAISVIRVSALKLVADYHANEVAADNLYKDRVLEVSGVVLDISKTFAGSVVLGIGAPILASVRAELDDGMIQKAAGLRKGEKITVKCKGSGMILGAPWLSRCLF